MVKIKRKYFDFSKIKELVASGIWNSVAQLGNVLSTGLDLLITNIFVGATSMGIVSVSKTIPTYVQSLFITVSSVFAPQLTISYAQEDREGVNNQLASSMKIMGVFASIPIAVIVAYGEAFYHLWVPNQDARILTYLTMAAVLEYPVSLLVYPLENVFATTNKVKISSAITIVTSLCSCITVLIAVQFADSELSKMMIVVGTSCIYNLIKNGIWIPIACAKILNINKMFFYKIITKSIFSTMILSLIALFLKKIIIVSSWGMMILSALVIGIIGVLINIFFLLNKSDRMVLINTVINKIRR
jgi:O-antigen/teichoic acid export membrane protein